MITKTHTQEAYMTAAPKKITEYVSKKQEMIPIPARIDEATLARAQAAAKKLDVSLREFIDGAIKMACDQVGK
jgi:hypothetical protein